MGFRRRAAPLAGALAALTLVCASPSVLAEPHSPKSSTTAWIAAAEPPAACAGRAKDVPGGPDGTGSCWPGPSNTGVPAGTQLTAYTGPCSITAANTVIDGKTVNCALGIRAANVTIKNSRINGTVILDTDSPGSSAWSLTLQDSEVDAGQVQLSAVGWGNLKVIRSNVHGGQTSVQCEENSVSCLVQDSYLHGQYLPSNEPWHLGGFLSDGGRNITLQHNFIVCDQPVNAVSEGCTGDVNLIPNFAPINGALIERNLLGANVRFVLLHVRWGEDDVADPSLLQRHLSRQRLPAGRKREMRRLRSRHRLRCTEQRESMDMQHLGQRRARQPRRTRAEAPG